MSWLKRIVVFVLAFVAGVVVDAVAVAVWIEATFDCRPVPGDPCDGGPILALGMFLMTAPVVGLLFALAAVVWMTLSARRKHLNRKTSP